LSINHKSRVIVFKQTKIEATTLQQTSKDLTDHCIERQIINPIGLSKVSLKKSESKVIKKENKNIGSFGFFIQELFG
jgi:hypothetical protein